MEYKGYMIIPGKWEIEYRYAAGEYATKFLKGLMEGKIFGVKCPSCRRVIVPPRKFCERCMVEPSEWIEVEPHGELVNFIIVYRKFHGLPDPPYAIGLIKLDGADDSILHFIGEVDLSSPHRALRVLKPGLKLEAVWADERKGTILDIKYFRPLKKEE
jgi:uncharacterized OB-fold protein